MKSVFVRHDELEHHTDIFLPLFNGCVQARLVRMIMVEIHPDPIPEEIKNLPQMEIDDDVFDEILEITLKVCNFQKKSLDLTMQAMEATYHLRKV